MTISFKTPYSRRRSQSSPRCDKDDALLIRYTAMPPKSDGSPKRRIGIRGITAATNLSSASTRAVMSLLIQPARIAFEVTP
jgi:hypothetical protein